MKEETKKKISQSMKEWHASGLKVLKRRLRKSAKQTWKEQSMKDDNTGTE